MQEKNYLPAPIQFTGRNTAADWMYRITKIHSDILQSIYWGNAKDFDLAKKSTALLMADMIQMCISWLDDNGFNESARITLFKNLNPKEEN